MNEKRVIFEAIGHVENEIERTAGRQAFRTVESRIVLDPALSDGLTGLEAGGKIMVVFYFHLSQGFELLQHGHGDRTRSRQGVFALRSPHRPNPIGVTVVDLLGVEGNTLHVRGLDAFNGTPVLDLKPAH